MNLLDYRKDVYTGTGNDGIIEKILKSIGIGNGFFVEFGAWDGVKGSNCRKLWEEGWKGIFIEGDQNKYLQLIKNYKPDSLQWPWYDKKYVFKDVTCINNFVGIEKNKFEDIVSGHVPKSGIDFCSIDIDGLDLEVFETFESLRPSVVCIEGGQMLEPNHPRVPKKIASNNIQQSLSVMTEVFNSRGYEILCTYQDTFYVKKEFYDLFDVSNNITELYYDGLEAHHRRIPWIQMKLSQVGISNNIVDKILSKTNYKKYGYNKRKVWAEEESNNIISIIQEEKGNL